MNYSDENRGTGRTTRLLDEAIAKNKPFIVHNHHFISYCEELRPQMRGRIHSITNPDCVRGMTNPIVDHCVWDFATLEQVIALWQVMH